MLDLSKVLPILILEQKIFYLYYKKSFLIFFVYFSNHAVNRQISARASAAAAFRVYHTKYRQAENAKHFPPAGAVLAAFKMQVFHQDNFPVHRF